MRNQTKPENTPKVELEHQPKQEQVHELIISEYDRLCTEIDHYLKEGTACVTFALGSSGAVWAWVSTNQQWNPFRLIWLPFILNLLIFWRWHALQQMTAKIGRYLWRTEVLYFDSKHGWESTMDRTHDGKKKNSYLGVWGAYFFTSLIFLSFVIAAAFEVCRANGWDKLVQDNQKATDVVTAINKLSDALETLQKQPVPASPLPEPAKPSSSR